ncbi:glucosyl-3-phosphoglycerate synthase [Plantactinospora sp. KLBMP9567]|uniref:glucosyl-3-phosphoglycerate synthase n=1 Tax=Plantactinospora sp. KLBMP9567 TaxID=3085900 RepID=UPI002980CDA1|nr:glucosyl-3-phosphoglycerate synthase [Plantactinospora sp. KLBMP9567]MDW5326750.1 glucosyl-3-phosphoglycerate synthase [Plantactinospora sp. KLBMP9567]
MQSEIRKWLFRRTSRADNWPLSKVIKAKGDTSISVVIPARNEEATIGPIVRMIVRELMTKQRLVDELVVVDSRSTDSTAQIAKSEGATVVSQDLVLRELPRRDGKGDALWKGLASTAGDLVAFIDGDLVGCPPAFIAGLVAPLLDDISVAFVKGYYHRPIVHSHGIDPDGGGRVTELVARPLLNVLWPELAGFVQPLAGEYAARRWVLESVPFATLYGVEIGLLIDIFNLVGLDAMAQVDLGQRQHRHQDTEALSLMSAQILMAAMNRRDCSCCVGEYGAERASLMHFRRGVDLRLPILDREIHVNEVSVPDRPPLGMVAEYLQPNLDRSCAQRTWR